MVVMLGFVSECVGPIFPPLLSLMQKANRSLAKFVKVRERRIPPSYLVLLYIPVSGVT